MIDDPQVLAFIAATDAAYPPEVNGATAVENRRHYDAMCAVFRAPRPDGLTVADRDIGGVHCRVHGGPGGVTVLYLHGGGFVVGGLDSHDDICAELADATGLRVVAVDYRLAPEHRWADAFADVRAVWDALDVPGIVAGDSAGGGLAASLCLSRPARMPLAQVLVYPALGGDGTAPSYRDNAEAPMLRTADLAAYHRAAHGDAPPHPLAEPLRVPDAQLAALPPALIVTADIDPLRDDGRDYAARLAGAGIAAVWRNEPQLPHGYLRARRSSDRARRSFQAIAAGIARLAAGGSP